MVGFRLACVKTSNLARLGNLCLGKHQCKNQYGWLKQKRQQTFGEEQKYGGQVARVGPKQDAATQMFATSLQMCAKTSSPYLQSWQKAWGLPSKNWPGSPLLNFTQQNPSSPATGPLPLPLPQWGTVPPLLKQAQKERKWDYLRCYLMSCMIKPT